MFSFIKVPLHSLIACLKLQRGNTSLGYCDCEDLVLCHFSVIMLKIFYCIITRRSREFFVSIIHYRLNMSHVTPIKPTFCCQLIWYFDLMVSVAKWSRHCFINSIKYFISKNLWYENNSTEVCTIHPCCHWVRRVQLL